MPKFTQDYTFEATHDPEIVVIHELGEPGYPVDAAALRRLINDLRKNVTRYSTDQYQSLMALYRSALEHLER